MMKLCAALAFAFLLQSTATPIQKDIFTRASDADICKREDDTFWKDYDMKSFVEQQAHIQAIELYQTQPNNPAKKKSFFNLLRAKLPRSFKCTDNDLPCRASDLVCADDPKVVKTIESVINYLNFLNTARSYLNEAVDEVTRNLASMQGKFNPSTKSEVGSNPLSPLSAGMGIAGTLAGLMSGPYGSFGSALISIAGTAITEFGPKAEDRLEVKFDGYAALGDALSRLVKGVTDGLNIAISDIFLQVVPHPGTRTMEAIGPFPASTILLHNTDPGYVSNVIAGGSFAVASSSGWPTIKKKMLASLYSQVINVLWKHEKIVVVRVSKKSLPIDPCDPSQPNIMFPDRWVKYCDPEGNMYVLQGRASEKDVQFGYPVDDKLWITPGFDELGKYELTPKDVLTSAWRNRGRTSPDGETSKQALSDYIKGNGEGSLPFFNLHTCDLDQVKETRGEWCKPEYTGDLKTLCTFYAKLDSCGSIDHGVDSQGNKLEWPWERFSPGLPPAAIGV